jgi:hypothetical protein
MKRDEIHLVYIVIYDLTTLDNDSNSTMNVHSERGRTLRLCDLSLPSVIQESNTSRVAPVELPKAISSSTESLLTGTESLSAG